MEESNLKRLVRAMNSCVNIYDVEDVPEELTDVLMIGVVKLAKMLKLDKIALYDDNGDLVKYVMPEDFDAWLNNNGVVEIDAFEETEETSS